MSYLLETFLVELDKIIMVFNSLMGYHNMGSRRESHLSWFSEKGNWLRSSNNDRSKSSRLGLINLFYAYKRIKTYKEEIMIVNFAVVIFM